MWLGRAARVTLAALLIACGGEEAPAVTGAPPPPEGCTAPEVALPDGRCIRPGVPLDGCAQGFEHDGQYGCRPILPAAPCPVGLMAVPGDAACRPIMACGDGTWGNIPVGSGTVYVDAS